MSTVQVEHSHTMSVADAKKALGAFEEHVRSKYGTKINWSGNQAELKGPGVSGSIVVTEAKATITLKLGMLAKAAGVKPDLLRESIQKRLVQAFAPSDG